MSPRWRSTAWLAGRFGPTTLLDELTCMAVPRQQRDKRACRRCGCTDDRACPGGCYWIDADLCSACGEEPV